MRRYGNPKDPNQTYTDRPGAYAVILSDKGILLTHQLEPEPEFQLPGGGIDPFESPLHALHREVLEETGWRVKMIKRLGAYQRYTYMPEYDLFARKVCHIYLMRAGTCLGPPREVGHSAVWADADFANRVLLSEGDIYHLNLVL